MFEAKTVGRLPEDQRWRAEEVLNIRGIPPNPVPGTGGDHTPIEVNGTKHAEHGEDEHALAREREKSDTRSTVAASDPTVRTMYRASWHIREHGASEGCPGCRRPEMARCSSAEKLTVNTRKKAWAPLILEDAAETERYRSGVTPEENLRKRDEKEKW